MYGFIIVLFLFFAGAGWLAFTIRNVEKQNCSTNSQTISDNVFDVQNLSTNLTIEEKNFLQKVSQELGIRYITQDDIKEFSILNITKDFAKIPDWDIWDYSAHSAPGQHARLGQAVQSQTMSIIDIDKEFNEIYIDDTEDNTTYITSADGCQCHDFIANDLPCKHMYFAVLHYEDYLENNDLTNNFENIAHSTCFPERSNRRIIRSSSRVIRQSDLGTMTIEATYSTNTVEIKQRTIGVLPATPIEAWNGYCSQSGGYVNFAKFQVIGKNPNTNRKNKRIYCAKSEEEACAKAKETDGLVEPFEITILPYEPPTQRQLDYAKNLEAIIPVGACKIDVSAIISRITDDDEAPAPTNLAKLANEYGLLFSRFHGTKAILNMAYDLPTQQFEKLKRIIQ